MTTHCEGKWTSDAKTQRQVGASEQCSNTNESDTNNKSATTCSASSELNNQKFLPFAQASQSERLFPSMQLPTARRRRRRWPIIGLHWPAIIYYCSVTSAHTMKSKRATRENQTRENNNSSTTAQQQQQQDEIIRIRWRAFDRVHLNAIINRNSVATVA